MSLTRESIRDGILQDMLERSGVSIHVTTEEERHASIAAMLGGRGTPAEDVWVFGYGSLMWNPAFHHAEQRLGTLPGWHRRFCLWTPLGRGSPDNPGLVLGLDNGGSCRGVAFRIRAAQAWEELDIVWRREMVSDGYTPRWATVRTDAGPVRAIAFTINHGAPRYAGKLALEDAARVIAHAEGGLGSCAEYLMSTVDHLDEMGIPDRRLHALRDRVKALLQARPRTAGAA
ncbi:Cation transport protein chaC [Caenispirillum salinarum AK4]|uniref:glutathione-specific gamma-glutamylcyclotransferase n=1 Tax=Caenispirillum salinarum AK4 TaxID=1238182 RepID=K9HVG1_9PROT|nr:gamma-glutamylcyclotransferase [Caenispirillum salinarum]EKV32211.1 Cation transport protein chaC [Caenispirillum salinarum AK4]